MNERDDAERLVYAYVTLEGPDRVGGYRYWVVQNCPFCGVEHSHGAGAPGEDPSDGLGSRVPHCGTGANEMYWLTEQPELHGRRLVMTVLDKEWPYVPPGW
jgi:hypothetical protein